MIAGLKYLGPAAGDVVKKFLNRVLAPAGDAIGETIAHPIVEWQNRRIERAAGVVADAALLLEREGIEPQAVPGRILMPLLERASIEDDAELRERWVRLLAAAASGDSNALPAYVSILSELSPQEVRILDWLYRHTKTQGPSGVVFIESTRTRALNSLDVSADLLPVLLGNLVRLGLARHPVEVLGSDIERFFDRRTYQIEEGYDDIPPADDFDAVHVEERFSMTELGAAFVEACSYPQHVQPA
ncbi:MAG: Abi-alpha family protein [Vicinamibacterales bacterium]